MLSERRMKLSAFASCALLVYLAAQASAELSCLNEEGEPVDWFIGYKFPKIAGEKLFEHGIAYSYITSDDVEPSDEVVSLSREVDSESKIFLFRFKDLLLKYLGFRAPKTKAPPKATKGKKKAVRRASAPAERAKWTASQKAISDPESIIMRTLAAVFDKDDSAKVSSIFYNDDPSGTEGANHKDDGEKPISGNNRRAHAKGTLLMDEESNNGVWLTHSVPRFPSIRGTPLEFPESGVKFGQTFMCISFELDKMGKNIVDHLVNMRPLVYDNHVSAKLLSMIPALKNLDSEKRMKRRRVNVKPKLSQVITTKGGQMLRIFAKSISFDADMYAGWIDEELGTDLYVETWRNGAGGVLNSSCPASDYHINNVQDLKYDGKMQWSYLKDHSKWAISEEQEVGVVCIGDSNRMASQFKRGGGAVCMKCPTCWNVFSNTIQDVEPCPRGTVRSQNPVSDKDMERIRSSLSL